MVSKQPANSPASYDIDDHGSAATHPKKYATHAVVLTLLLHLCSSERTASANRTTELVRGRQHARHQIQNDVPFLRRTTPWYGEGHHPGHSLNKTRYGNTREQGLLLSD